MNDAPTIAPSRESASDNTRHETSELTGRENTPGKNCDAKSFTGTSRLNTTPRLSPVSVIRSGKSFVSASVKIRPSNKKARVQYFSVARVQPKNHAQARNRTAFRTSTIR